MKITPKESALVLRALEAYEWQNEGLFAHGEHLILRSLRAKLKEKRFPGVTEKPADMLPELNHPTV